MLSHKSVILVAGLAILAACTVAPEPLPMREDVRTSTVGAIKVGNTYYFSGHTGRNREPREYPPTMGEQTRNVMENFEIGLSELGLSWDNVVRATVYITDMSMKPEMNAAYNPFFEGHKKPTRVCVEAGLEGAALVEISIIAVAMAQ